MGDKAVDIVLGNIRVMDTVEFLEKVVDLSDNELIKDVEGETIKVIVNYEKGNSFRVRG